MMAMWSAKEGLTLPDNHQGALSVVIAIDPHKASWTAAVVSSALAPLATLRTSVNRQGYKQLRRFAARWPEAVWAVEGARGLGAPLTTWLTNDGITVVDVPAKLAARVRLLSTGHGRKNDDADAISIGIAAWTSGGLRSATVDQTLVALRALVEHRDDIVRTRTQTVNRLHVLLTQLLPGGAPRELSAETAAKLLATVRPRAPGARTLRRIAADLIAETRHLDRRIVAITREISEAVHAAGSTLTQLRGIGDLTAAKILARTGDITRFHSAAAYASYTGTAPIEASSGDVVRHRLSRFGDRQLNCCLHIMALSQIQRASPGRDYYERKRATGKSHKEAMRCLKRRLSDIVYRQIRHDAQPRKTPHPDQPQPEPQPGAGPGGQQGATTNSSAASTTPTADASDQSQPAPASPHTTTTTRSI
jgi:transposase